MSASKPVLFEGLHCTMRIARPAPQLVVMTIVGSDVGEFGDAPFRELERGLDEGRVIDFFIDGRATRGASIDVSNAWALWLRRHREALHRVTMLTGSRFLQVTADFVRQFAELGDLMQLTTDPSAFDSELVAALRRVDVL